MYPAFFFFAFYGNTYSEGCLYHRHTAQWVLQTNRVCIQQSDQEIKHYSCLAAPSFSLRFPLHPKLRIKQVVKGLHAFISLETNHTSSMGGGTGKGDHMVSPKAWLWDQQLSGWDHVDQLSGAPAPLAHREAFLVDLQDGISLQTSSLWGLLTLLPPPNWD